MAYLGPIMKRLAYAIWVIVFLIALLYDLIYLMEVSSPFAFAGWIIILPITLLVVPFQVMFDEGHWFPMLFTYGGIVVGVIVYTIGRMMLAEDLQTGRVEPEE